jgi:hypothetical protein
MPLDAFIAETIALFRQEPTPPEIHGAEAAGYRGFIDAAKFDQMFRVLNQI